MGASTLLTELKITSRVLVVVTALAILASIAQYQSQSWAIGATIQKAPNFGRGTGEQLAYTSWAKGRELVRAGKGVIVDVRILGDNNHLPDALVWPIGADEASIVKLCRGIDQKVPILYGNDEEVGKASKLLKEFCRIKVLLRAPQPYLPE